MIPIAGRFHADYVLDGRRRHVAFGSHLGPDFREFIVIQAFAVRLKHIARFVEAETVAEGGKVAQV